MALDKANIVEAIEKDYNLSGIIIDTLLQEKGGRQVYRISSNEWVFVIKIADIGKSEDDMIKDMYIFDFAEKNGFNYLPKILKTKSNSCFAKSNLGLIHIMGFVDGGQPEDTPENRSTIGKITAELHNLKNYRHESTFSTIPTNPSYEGIASQISFWKEYLEVVAELPDFTHCSRTVIHTDIGLHNAAQDRAGNIYFLDRDWVWINYTILDLWFPLISQFVTSDCHFKREHAKAFYDSYFANRSFPQEERKLIFDASLFFALIYLPYSDANETWKRIQFSIANKEELSSVFM
jgi:Ser/Thr protein kinase RdoA (MazF antagonist)